MVFGNNRGDQLGLSLLDSVVVYLLYLKKNRF